MIIHLLIFVSVNILCRSHAGTVPMEIKNNAGVPIEVFWVNTNAPQNQFVKQSDKPIRNASHISIKSYVGHEFLVKTYHDGNNITSTGFVKGAEDETITVQLDGLKRQLSIKQTTKFDDLKNKVKLAMKSCEDMGRGGEDLTDCLGEKIGKDLQKLSDAKEEIEKYRNTISYKLRNYTCADPNIETSKPIRSRELRISNKTYTLQTMFDTSHAKIMAIPNFLSEEECGHFIKYGTPRLRRATVAAEDGSSTISIHRKAQQAGYDLHSRPRDPLWDLYHRILHVTNAYTGFRLQPDGQEDFTIIQYNVDDQYTPHCDGSCDGQPHNPGGRLATAVLYCKAPELGGATSFSKADVFVKPVVGQATFFSYRGPDGLMDAGFTEHSGCPVLQGEKWITTFWMRDGVSKEQPWTIFDPSGIPILDTETVSVDEDGEVEYEQ